MIQYRATSENLPIRLWWRDDTGQLINLSTYDSFEVEIQSGGVEHFAKTTGITGAAGSGASPTGTPNLVITWVDGDFDTVPVGAHKLVIRAIDAGLELSHEFDFELLQDITTSSWTYGGDPTSSPRDQIRFLVGDTDSTDQLITDQEISYMLSMHPNAYEAASHVCLAIAAKMARCMDKSVGSLSRSYSQKYEHYKELAADLKQQAAGQSSAIPWAAGWRRSDDDARLMDTDVRPLFAERSIYESDGYEERGRRDSGYDI